MLVAIQLLTCMSACAGNVKAIPFGDGWALATAKPSATRTYQTSIVKVTVYIWRQTGNTGVYNAPLTDIETIQLDTGDWLDTFNNWIQYSNANQDTNPVGDMPTPAGQTEMVYFGHAPADTQNYDSHAKIGDSMGYFTLGSEIGRNLGFSVCDWHTSNNGNNMYRQWWMSGSRPHEWTPLNVGMSASTFPSSITIGASYHTRHFYGLYWGSQIDAGDITWTIPSSSYT
jgi:hypothetical protein